MPRPIQKGLNQDLTELRLINITLGNEYIKSLSKCLKVIPKLSLIQLQDNNLPDESFALLLKGLLNNSYALKKVLYKG